MGNKDVDDFNFLENNNDNDWDRNAGSDIGGATLAV